MPDTLLVNSKLNPGDELRSANGTFVLKFQNDGNLVLYIDSSSRWAIDGGGATAPSLINCAIWNTFPHTKGASQCILQADGNFVIYKPGGNTPANKAFASNTNGKGGTHLVVQDDGNVVLYTADSKSVWATNTSVGETPGVNTSAPDTGGAPLTSSPDFMEPPQTLNLGQELRSANGTFALKFQMDGNLVLYIESKSKYAGRMNRAVWNSRSENRGATHFVAQKDGNFVIYKPGGDVPHNSVFATGTNDGTWLVVQDDGNVVLYDLSKSIVWQTSTSASFAPGVNTTAPLPPGFQ
jgi:hypothetical protein